MSIKRKADKHLPAEPTEAVPGRVDRHHATRNEDVLAKVHKLVATRHYDRALQLINSSGQDRRLLNAQGVCLLRLGSYAEAMRVYYGLVLNPGCTWLRPDAPLIYKTNYATALLLGGRPSGCLDILAELKAEQNETVQRLRAAIKQWEASLSFWRRLNWRLGRIEPANCVVPLSFEAGELEPLPSTETAPDAPRRTPRAA